MSPTRIIGVDAAIKEGEDAIPFMEKTIRFVLTDVLVNDMLRDAKINAKGRKLGRGGTGHLARNIFHKVEQARQKFIGSLNVDLTTVPYGRIHEKGGTIVPRRRRFLTVPFPGIKGFARDFQNTFIAKNTIFQKLPGGNIRPLFSLKRQVIIPRRAYMEPAIKKHEKKLATELKQKLNKE